MAKRRSPKTVESRLPPQGALRTKEDQDRLAGAALLDGQGRVDPLALAVNVTAATTPFTRGIALKPPFSRRKDRLRGSASIKARSILPTNLLVGLFK